MGELIVGSAPIVIKWGLEARALTAGKRASSRIVRMEMPMHRIELSPSGVGRLMGHDVPSTD